jgi:GH15 family glucan-1,4-alpha-glucosidase
MINWLCDNWHQEDEGIWEMRGGRRHFVYSKLMCWVALDRALRLANKRSFPADHDKWLKTRDQIYEEIMEKGWNNERQAFVQSYHSDTLDAANLIMPLVFFVSPSDPRMLKTLDAILKSPREGGLVADSLVYRYDIHQTVDGLEGREGTFNMCTFWLVEALTRSGCVDHRRLDHARLLFEKMLGYANHVGLYAEETGPRGEALGNFPQAFTHLSLISAAYNLDRALGKQAG